MGKPTIRFEGYTDDWEQRKLSEISDVRDGTHDSPSYLNDGHPFVTSKNVKDGYINYDDIKYISDEDFEAINKRSKVDVNDILMGMIGTIGNLALIRTEPDFAIKNVALIKDTKQVSYMYLYHYLQSSSTERQLLSGLDGGTQKFVSLKNIRELNIMVPSEAEQLKVGNFIESLDHLITLHQRKYINGKKEELLAWEQRKFGDLVEKYEDPVKTPTEGYMRLGIRSHAKGTFHSYVEKGKELETAKMFRVAADKFIVNITFGWEHAVAITDEDDAGKLVSHRFPQYSFNNGILPKFFRYLILDEKFKHHLELSSPGGAGRNRVLKLSDMLEYKMNFPCEEEQRKIAVYFDDLDHLITLHQRKCEELQNIKKFMLQNMFV